MEAEILISALSLFAGASLMPAAFIILRDKEVPLDRHWRLRGGAALVMAMALLGLAVMFLLNAVAQDARLLLALLALLVALPLLIIAIDKRRRL